MMERRRSSFDRRSGSDRRRVYTLGRFLKRSDERRNRVERRSKNEERQGWVKIDKWSSVRLDGLKIAKFLR